MLCISVMLCLSVIQLASGCKKSVYEERGECPCLLRIGFTGNYDIESYQIWILDADGNLLKRDYFHKGEAGETYYETTIPRCIFNIYVWGNTLENTLIVSDGANSLIKQNMESSFDRLYYGSAMGNSHKEDVVTMDIEMCKQYSAVELNISCKAENKIDLEQISVLTITNSVGYYLNGWSIEGRGAIQTTSHSSAHVNREDGNAGNDRSVSFEYNMARPSSLNGLEIKLKEGGKDIITIDFGNMLKARNYDIKKKNLDDINIDIDLSTGTCLISCKDWEEVDDVDIVM